MNIDSLPKTLDSLAVIFNQEINDSIISGLNKEEKDKYLNELLKFGILPEIIFFYKAIENFSGKYFDNENKENYESIEVFSLSEIISYKKDSKKVNRRGYLAIGKDGGGNQLFIEKGKNWVLFLDHMDNPDWGNNDKNWDWKLKEVNKSFADLIKSIVSHDLEFWNNFNIEKLVE